MIKGRMMNLGTRGETIIKSYETLRLEAYLPTKDDVWTIGWGHTRGVKQGDTCTRDQAQVWFNEDVADAVAAVNRLPCKLTQSMFDALVSLVFNVGPGAIKAGKDLALKQEDIGATIWRELAGRFNSINRTDYFAACQAFFLWRKQNKKDLLGLARRRAKEMILFLEDGLPT